MSYEAMREKFNYTQRPDAPREFLVSDIANALEITVPCAYSLITKLNLDYIKRPDGRGHNVMYFNHDAIGLCREELERREAKKRATGAIVRKETEAAQAEHPLVTDPNFLKLSYFPETTPACFSEVDE